MLRMENFRRSFSVKGKRPAIIALAVILFLAAAFYLPPGRSIVAACREDALMLKLVRASGAEFESVNITGWVRADESAGDPEALAERAAEQLGILLPGHKTEKWQNQYARGARVEGAVTGGRTVSVLGQALLQPEGERVSHLMISLDGMDNGEALFYRQKVYKTLGAFGRQSHVALTYRGKIESGLSREELLACAEKIMELAGAPVREKTVKDNLVSLTGFSPLFSGGMTYAGKEVNLNVALRSSPAERVTRVYIASPVIFTEY